MESINENNIVNILGEQILKKPKKEKEKKYENEMKLKLLNDYNSI